MFYRYLAFLFINSLAKFLGFLLIAASFAKIVGFITM